MSTTKKEALNVSIKDYITRQEKSQEAKREILQKLQLHKKQQEKIINLLLEMEENKRATNLKDCGTYVEITNCPECGAHITAANFCKERVCPVCSWRRQGKYRAEFQKMLELIQPSEGSLRHLTLTVRSVPQEELTDCLNQMFYAWKKLCLSTEWKKHIVGSSRTLEITYNKDKRTYHPHFHCLLQKKGNLSKAKIGEAWKKALAVTYYPEIEIKKLTDEKGILECFKYAFKASEATEPMLTAILYTLKGRRLVGFTGSFKQARAMLKLPNETVLTDTPCIYSRKMGQAITQEIYRFDFTGGIYRLYKPLSGSGTKSKQ